jgi:hypothetical protein
MSNTETLTDVSDSRRADENLYVTTAGEQYYLQKWDETLSINFDDVSVYMEIGSEWASFMMNGERVAHICNEKEEEWPHWLFEELHFIEESGDFRPDDGYDVCYQLNEQRAVKAREA